MTRKWSKTISRFTDSDERADLHKPYDIRVTKTAGSLFLVSLHLY